MNGSTTKATKQFSGCASLAALGVHLRQLGMFEPIRQTVRIAQKTAKHTLLSDNYYYCRRMGIINQLAMGLELYRVTHPCQESGEQRSDLDEASFFASFYGSSALFVLSCAIEMN